MKQSVIIVILAAMLANTSLYAQVQVLNIAPRTTDSRIDTAFEDHYAFINRSTQVQRRNQLVVFFPGTGAEPRSYRVFPTVAANLGFHGIGLNYPNDETVNGRCGTSNADLDCNAAIRGETLDGIDRSPLASVSRTNSIENRLVKLLQYLHRQFPQDNWAQFLERSTSGDTLPRWQSIVVAGHSQGGGYAGYIATVRRTARCIMFGAMDYIPAARRIANWMTAPKLTPHGEFFAMGHVRDELVPYSILSEQAWAAYNILSAGPILNADTARAPFRQTRAFSTNQESPALGSLVVLAPRHNVPVVDVNTPQTQGRYAFQPVWEYMLTAPALTTNIREEADVQSYTIAPNPASTLLFVKSVMQSVTQRAHIIITNALGQTLMERTTDMPCTLDISSLPNGVYAVNVMNTSAQYPYQTAQMLTIVR